MTQEEKHLLLVDLCARLPYGVKCYAYQPKIDGNDCECYGTLEGILYERFYLKDRVSVNRGFTYDNYYLEVKPYLRPMSSMTEEEKAIYSNYKIVVRGLGIVFEYNLDFVTEWLLKHHFDYRGLIEKGIAIEVTDENNPYEE